ncbi:GGDEF domain-containing protein [Aquincola tertiaricarbonis]|uniref:diguanylate cyclase n=1 Tax=Aquincola tertiaricarbonis TaxID=391953 RepID=A0ABY4S7S2_AQUTE|nr:GGDEF domain-containing protein [Aquincola tertiaricarbonis]URI09049.1 GGDEF domain-containing protein [Aquincola tertiaricarbonis]
MPHTRRLAEITKSVGELSFNDYLTYLAYAEINGRKATLRVQGMALFAWLVVMMVAPGSEALSSTKSAIYGVAMVMGLAATALAPRFLAGAVARVFFAVVLADALGFVVSQSPYSLLWQVSICAIVVVAMSPVHYEPISYGVATLLINLCLLVPRGREIVGNPEAGWMMCMLVAAFVFGVTINALQFLDRMKLNKVHRRLAELAFKDGLTRINNRRAFVGELIRATQQLDETGLYLFLIDADDFKSINDRHGHDIGDEVLQFIAARIRAVAGEADCGRLGGEEFGMICRGDRLRAQGQAAALNQAITATPIRGITVSVSIGVAEYRRGMLIPRLLKMADEALYHAKRSGKNRYHFAEPQSP